MGAVTVEIEAISPQITPSSDPSSMGYPGSCARGKYANSD